MTKQEIYREMEEQFGFVPLFLKALPDDTLERDWEHIKMTQFGESGAVPAKYKQLAGLAAAAAVKGDYAVLWHTEMAKAKGATDAEIREVLRYVYDTVGWSVLLSGVGLDYDEFNRELHRMEEHMSSRERASV